MSIHGNRAGFGVVGVLSVITALVIIVGTGWYVYKKDHKTSLSKVTGSSTKKSTANKASTKMASTNTITNKQIPVLGQLWGPPNTGQEGYGTVRPQTINNGGDPTGIVTDIIWQSWGGSQAMGTGMSDYVAGNEDVADGTTEQVKIVAFNLGICQGKTSYNAVEWYFPQNGQAFNTNWYRNICTGQSVRN